MRRVVAVGLGLAIAASIGAQAPAASTPAAPAAAAAKPKGGTKNELRVSGIFIQGERSYDFFNNVRNASGTTKGVEVLMRTKAIGLQVRSLSGAFGKDTSEQPQLISADARILLFPPAFSIFLGGGKRGLVREGFASTVRTMMFGGVSSTAQIGGSGLRTHVSAAYLFSPGVASGTGAKPPNSTGIEGEAAILYRFGRAPVFMQVGYRTEIFTGKGATASSDSPEEVRGIRVGGGIQLGGR